MKVKLLFGILLFLLIFSASQVRAQGETCATAVAVTPGSYTANGPATGGGAYAASCKGSDATNSDWYSFTPATDGYLDIGSCGGGSDTRLTIYDGTCGALNCIAFNDDDCDEGYGNGYASQITNLFLTASNTYYIEWDDYWDYISFDWSFTFTPGSGMYCTPAPISVDGSGITNVTFSTVNNTTGDETGHYGDYSAMVGDVEQTASIPVAITLAT